MTVKVAGLWELGWSAPFTEFDLWTFLLRDFEVVEWYMSPVSGIDRKQVTELADITEVVNLNPTLTPIVVDERGSNFLADYNHPDNALYLFGKANRSLLRDFPDAESVAIETDGGGSGLLWPHQAAGIVLYDRLRKSWQ